MQGRLARLALVFALMVAPAWAWAAYQIHGLENSCATPPCHYMGDLIVVVTGLIGGLGAVAALILLGVLDRRRANRDARAI